MKATRIDLFEVPELRERPPDVQNGIIIRVIQDRELMAGLRALPAKVECYAWVCSLTVLFGGLVLGWEEAPFFLDVIGCLSLPIVLMGGEYQNVYARYRKTVIRFLDEHLEGKFDAASYGRSFLCPRNHPRAGCFDDPLILQATLLIN